LEIVVYLHRILVLFIHVIAIESILGKFILKKKRPISLQPQLQLRMNNQVPELPEDIILYLFSIMDIKSHQAASLTSWCFLSHLSQIHLTSSKAI